MQQIEQYYLRHKDAFKVDQNNLIHGQKLRKITVLVYLNPELDQVKAANPQAKLGELRLYLPKKIVDVVPRMGRAVIFKSEILEHEVRPTLGYDRFAVTVWFNQLVRKPEASTRATSSIPDDFSIFVGIPSYRDPELVETIKSLVQQAQHPDRLRIVIFLQHNLEVEKDQQTLAELETYVEEAQMASGARFHIE